MINKSCAVAIIGGGPAGISAAETIAEQGTASIVLNDSNTLGGHFFKMLPNEFDGLYSSQNKKNVQEFKERVQRLDRNQAEVLNQASVWGIFQEPNTSFQIYAEHPQHNTIAITTQAIIMAPGVYDRSLPFPGWELPGVITPGAVQIALQKQGLLPGKKILVCGTGPLQFVVAAALVNEGVEVVALLDTSGTLDGMPYIFGAFGGLLGRLNEALHSFQSMVINRVPIMFRHAIFQALGSIESGVTGAIIGKIDQDGHPIPGTEQTLEVDTICCAYGFTPSIALTLHLGCKHIYNPELSAYVPWYDEDLQTDVPGVFVAGDITGAGGKPLADLQGALAGISVVKKLGRLSSDAAKQKQKRLESSIQRQQRFSRWLWNRYRIREGLLDLIKDDTLICRCENVTAGQIKKSLENGAGDLYGVKLRTRMGMGSCQGRYCTMNTALLISKHTGFSMRKIGLPSIRPPITPTRLKNIAAK